MSYEIENIEHDADAGLVVRADDLNELFRAAALGMLDIILDREEIPSLSTRLVHAQAESTELLLVNFLSTRKRFDYFRNNRRSAR